MFVTVEMLQNSTSIYAHPCYSFDISQKNHISQVLSIFFLSLLFLSKIKRVFSILIDFYATPIEFCLFYLGVTTLLEPVALQTKLQNVSKGVWFVT